MSRSKRGTTREPAPVDALPLLPTPADLVAHFYDIGPRLEPALAVRTSLGYYSHEGSPYRRAATEAMASMGDEQRRAALAYLFDVALQKPGNRVFRSNSENSGRWLVTIIGRRKLAWTVEQLAWLARFVRVRHHQLDEEGLSKTLALLTSAVERTPAELEPLLEDLRWLSDWMVRLVRQERQGHSGSWWWVDPKLEAYAARLHAVIGAAGPATLPSHVLDRRDGFGPRARAALLAVVDEPRAADLVALLGEYGSAPRPPVRWRTRAASVLSARPDLRDAARALVRTAGNQPDPDPVERVYPDNWIREESQALVRAALWATALTDGSLEVTSELRDLACHAAQTSTIPWGTTRSMSIVNAVVEALRERPATVPTAVVVSALLTIRLRATNRAVWMSVDKALAGLAAAAGVSLAELTEEAVPTYGLDRDGRRTLTLGAHVLTLQATTDGGRGDATLSWSTTAGRRLSGVPAAVRRDHPSDLAELRRTVQDIRKSLPPQRDRLDGLMAGRRSWTVPTWQRHYLDHPLVGLFARSLLWRSGVRVGLPERADDGAWHLRSADGGLMAPDPDAPVTLWHPLGEPLEEVLSWRTHVVDRETRQPFKQVFREIYLLTPAEEQTATYSHRFAAHVLRFRQAAALMRGRGWRAPALGYGDLDDQGDAQRSFGDLRASFHLALLGASEDEPEFCVTDQVRFERRTADGAWRTVALSAVDPLVFSEALRDIDLFVGVSSIGADPHWLDNVQHDHRDYWGTFSFGELTSSAEMRREAVQRIIPRTKIRDRARVEGRFLVVRGALHTYKIHLGSGNVLMSPNDTYLCIVPRPDAGTSPVFLPFEEDGRLSAILSKAFLLADDNSITDPDITHQLGIRGR